MNWIDRAIAVVAPVSGLRRQAARAMMQRSVPRQGRRYAGKSERGFYVNTGNLNDARPKRYVDRQTILQLVADNPFARKSLNALLNSLVGWGITGAPQGSKKIQDAWAEWIKVCDFRGRLDFYKLQELVVRSMLRDGEVFIVPRYVAGVTGVPLRLQLFDKGMLATHLVSAHITRGIEYDADGNAIGYHFVRGRQGQRWSSQETIRFSAEECIHLFDDEWIGQTEGVSVFESVVKRLGDVDEGIDAEVVKANIAACMVGFRTRPAGIGPNDDDPNIGMPVEVPDYDRAPVEEFTAGMIETLEPGEEITFSSPPRTNGVGDLTRIALLASSAGVGVTYEQMTGDLSNVNFSSFKAGHLDFKRTVGRTQYLTLMPIALDRVWAWFMKAGIDFGQFPNKPCAIKWTPPPFETIDREGEAKADILEMQAGLENRPNLLSSRGYDHDEMMEATAKAQAKLKELGMAFKGDPFTPFQTDKTDPTGTPDVLAGRMLATLLSYFNRSDPHAA